MIADLDPANQRVGGDIEMDVLDLGLRGLGNEFDDLEFLFRFRLFVFVGGADMKISL